MFLAPSVASAQEPDDGQSCVPSAFPVALDIGHSSARPGATSARGRTEFSFNQTLAKGILRSLHDAGFTKSVLVNADGTMRGLAERPAAALAAGARLFVSVHHDSVQPRYLKPWTVDGRPNHYSDDFSGHSLFVSRTGRHVVRSLFFAQRLGEAMLARQLSPTMHHAEPIPGENRTLLDRPLGIYQFDELAVLRNAQLPAVLFEAGIIVNRDEEAALMGSERRAAIADAFVDAAWQTCAAFGAATAGIPAEVVADP